MLLLNKGLIVERYITFESNIKPDELPDGKTWDNLSVADTNKYFALGIKANDASNWNDTSLTDYKYVKRIERLDKDIKVFLIKAYQKLRK